MLFRSFVAKSPRDGHTLLMATTAMCTNAASGKKLPFDSLAQLRQAMFKAVPHLMRIDQIEASDAAGVKALAARGGSVEKGVFKSPIEDFYLTNPIARASAVMARESSFKERNVVRARYSVDCLRSAPRCRCAPHRSRRDGWLMPGPSSPPAWVQIPASPSLPGIPRRHGRPIRGRCPIACSHRTAP